MPSSSCFYLYAENLSLPVFVPILAYKKNTCPNMPVSLLHFFRITHRYSIKVIEISSGFVSQTFISFAVSIIAFKLMQYNSWPQ